MKLFHNIPFFFGECFPKVQTFCHWASPEICILYQEASLSAPPVMFSDIKGYSCSPMHMRPRCFEATWNASIDKLVSQEACSREGLHCTLHPDLVAKTKGIRAAACDAKDVLKRRFQAQFQERIGVRCFFPEPIHGGNSNTGNVATRVFQNSAISAEILQIPESLLVSMWELLKAISSSEFQDVDAYEKNARRVFDLWTTTFDKQMTANVHLLVAHGGLYLKWAQNEVGVPLGILTEGAIEKCNQDVKKANSNFVARTSVENIHRNILVRRSWEADPVLHYESTVLQVMLSTVTRCHDVFLQQFSFIQVIKRGNIRCKPSEEDA